jgi:FkbH-like protein
MTDPDEHTGAQKPVDPILSASRLRKAGDLAGALNALRDALRRGQCHASDHERAGRFLRKSLPDDPRPVDVRILGQCTTTWLMPVLSAVAFGRDLPLRVTEGDYDNVLQDDAPVPDVLVLVPWTTRLFAHSSAGDEQRIADELAFWAAAWEKGRGARIVQVGYDWTGPGADGALLGAAAGGRVALVRKLNEALRERLPAGGAFVDLSVVSGTIGREHFYDARRYHWTKQPFSEDGTLRLAQHLHAAIRALLTGPKKVLVVDLDNTLWGGVVGEVGPGGVDLGATPAGEAFRAFQWHLKDLARRGIVLAVSSKNNPADGREPFLKNPDMVLRLEDFAAFETNWEPKARSLARMAESLRLGLDSFVFFDDNPAEREHIRQALPLVEVVDVPEDPSDFVAALENGLFFEAAALTREDALRSSQYQAEQRRAEAEAAFASLDDYLASLDMVADLRPVDEADLARVVQLLAKTNQFNLTTRRHGDDWVRERLADPRSILLSVRVADRFGDHGLVALIFGVPDGGDVIRVDTMLMSCRVIGRTVEHHLWDAFVKRAWALGYRKVRCEYVPTAKNAQVAGLWTTFGLAAAGEAPGGAGDESGGGGGCFYEAALNELPAQRSFLRAEGGA